MFVHSKIWLLDSDNFISVFRRLTMEEKKIQSITTYSKLKIFLIESYQDKNDAATYFTATYSNKLILI